MCVLCVGVHAVCVWAPCVRVGGVHAVCVHACVVLWVCVVGGVCMCVWVGVWVCTPCGCVCVCVCVGVARLVCVCTPLHLCRGGCVHAVCACVMCIVYEYSTSQKMKPIVYGWPAVG